MRRLAKPLLALGLPGLFLIALACDSANPVAPPGTVLTVNANPSKIAIRGEAATITILGFRPDGNPLNPGTQVNLNTNLGDLGSTLVTVGENGVAQTTLTGDGRAGTATINATLTSGGEAAATTDVQIGEPDTTRQSIIITANPTTVATGEASRISILARESDGTPVQAGNRIRLTANLGKIVAAGGDANSAEINEVFTDANGEAFATFIAGDRGGQGDVTAIVGTSEASTVNIEIRAAIETLVLSVDRDRIPRNDAGEQINMTVLLEDARGEPVGRTTVRFSAFPGALSCNSNTEGLSSIGSFQDVAVISDTQGRATNALTVDTTDLRDVPQGGFFTIFAEATSEGQDRCDVAVIQLEN